MHPRVLLLLAGLLVASTRLPGGDDSLIRSLCFRRDYLRTHAIEDAIVLTTEGPGKTLGAVAVVTDKGAVLAQDDISWPLRDLEADAIDHPDRLRSAIASSGARRPSSNSPLSLTQATAKLWAVGVAADTFPASGSRPQRLVFDWNGRHVTYAETQGCTFEEARETPLTGYPATTAPWSSLVDALVFVQRYRAAHSAENAVLILPEPPALGQRLLGGAAFTRDGHLCLYSNLFGTWQVQEKEPSLLSDKRALQGLLAHALAKASHSGDPKAWYLLASLASQPFRDDSARLSLYRLRDALQAAHVPAMVNEDVRTRSGAPDPEASRLVFEWEGRQFGYMPSKGSYDKGPVATAIRTSFLDDLLFVQAYAAAHPTEQVALLVHPPSAAEADRKRVADALYTREGRVRLHSLIVGDIPIDTLHPEDFKDPAKLQAEASRAFAERRAHHPSPVCTDAKPLDQEEAQRRLLAAGIRAGVVPVKHRSEDGGLEPMAGGAVRFGWMGKDYLYLDNACYAQSANGADTL